MRFAVLILAAPNSRGSELAAEFCRAALNKGHAITRVFFYLEGAVHGLHSIRSWRDLSATDVPLAICTTMASELGITEAPGFALMGLGQWVADMADSDRVLTFR